MGSTAALTFDREASCRCSAWLASCQVLQRSLACHVYIRESVRSLLSMSGKAQVLDRQSRTVCVMALLCHTDVQRQHRCAQGCRGTWRQDLHAVCAELVQAGGQNACRTCVPSCP